MSNRIAKTKPKWMDCGELHFSPAVMSSLSEDERWFALFAALMHLAGKLTCPKYTKARNQCRLGEGEKNKEKKPRYNLAFSRSLAQKGYYPSL